jgi:hypothetical protein
MDKKLSFWVPFRRFRDEFLEVEEFESVADAKEKRTTHMKIIETTPEVITPATLDFAQKIGAAEAPRYVPVKPEDHSRVGRCYHNVDAVAAALGGEPVEGWLIWEESGHRWYLGIHHCVWRSPRGELLDVTPHQDGEVEILFAPGPRRWDRVHPVANVYQPLVYDGTVRRYCQAQNDYWRWMERNTCADLPYVPDYRLAQLAREILKLSRKLSL